jgi:hypothetical protein
MKEHKFTREVIGAGTERHDYAARYPLAEYRPVMKGIVVESAGARAIDTRDRSISKRDQYEQIRLEISDEEGSEANEEVVKTLIAGLEAHPRFSRDSAGGEHGYLYKLYTEKPGGMRDEMETGSWRDDMYAIMDAAE